MEKTLKIGSFLKQKREEQNLSINDVASKTKINLNILKHLESNALDKLPNKTYVKGFVKSYCKLLGLNIDEALEHLELTYNPETPAQEVIQSDMTPDQSVTPPLPSQLSDNTQNDESINQLQEKLVTLAQSIFSKKVMLPIIVLAIVAVILKGVVSFFVQLSDEQKELASNSKKSQTEVIKEEVKKDSIVADSKLTIDPTIKSADKDLFESEANKKLKEEVINNIEKKKAQDKELAEQALKKEQKLKAAAEAKKIEDEKVALEKAKKEEEENKKKQQKKKEEAKKRLTKLNGKFPFKRFSKAPMNMYQALSNAPENKDTNLLPNRFKNAVENGKENIYIHATSGDTWISYQSDDNNIKRFVLKKGRSVLIKGKVVLLFMGNINVAHIYYNNQLLKIKSKTGVKSLIFPQSEAANYELPLFPAFNGVPYKASEYKANMIEE